MCNYRWVRLLLNTRMGFSLPPLLLSFDWFIEQSFARQAIVSTWKKGDERRGHDNNCPFRYLPPPPPPRPSPQKKKAILVHFVTMFALVFLQLFLRTGPHYLILFVNYRLYILSSSFGEPLFCRCVAESVTWLLDRRTDGYPRVNLLRCCTGLSV